LVSCHLSEKEWDLGDEEISPNGTSNGTNAIGTDGNGIGGYGEDAADAAFSMLMPAPEDATDDYINPIGDGQTSPMAPSDRKITTFESDNV
jgi:hypothetical protein